MMCLSLNSGQIEGQASLKLHRPAESELIKNNECFCQQWSTPHCSHFTFILHHSVNLSHATSYFIIWIHLAPLKKIKLHATFLHVWFSLWTFSEHRFKRFNALSQKKEKFGFILIIILPRYLLPYSYSVSTLCADCNHGWITEWYNQGQAQGPKRYRGPWRRKMTKYRTNENNVPRPTGIQNLSIVFWVSPGVCY